MECKMAPRGDGAFVAVGGLDATSPSSSLLITSTDGANWTRMNSATQNNMRAIVYGGTKFVVGELGAELEPRTNAESFWGWNLVVLVKILASVWGVD